MIKITILGSGNVAQQLIQAFASAYNIEIIQVFARNPIELSGLIDKNKISSIYLLILTT